MITRCYLEITNVCNLDCAFCPKTKRRKGALTMEQYDALTDRLKGNVKFLYFHLMGEPFVHRNLAQMVAMARDKGMVPVLTTNGTLLKGGEGVLDSRPYKIQISLHSQEGNGIDDIDGYVDDVMNFAMKAAEKGVIIVLRLWNEGGLDKANERILARISTYAPLTVNERQGGWTVMKNIYVEQDSKFEWPDSEREEIDADKVFCYALRNQVGVLVDGSVVPCCLDHDGDIVLGNLYEQGLDEILSSDRARAMYDGFGRHEAVEPLCRRCGYATLTKRYRE